MKFDRTKMVEALRRVVQRLHYPLEVMLVCVRWNAAASTGSILIDQRCSVE